MRVLIVEDSSTDARIVQRLIRHASDGAAVSAASRLSDALAMVERDPFDVIVLDMTLPDAEGIDAVRRMRAAVPRVPIVILSGLENEEIATEAMQAGAQDYLMKGRVDEVGLYRALRYAIERQQLLDRLAASEARLQEENVILRRLADAAGRVFATLDVRAVVGLLAAESRRLWGGSVALYALRSSGELVSTEAPGSGRQMPDAFVYDALGSRRPLLNDDRTRLTLPIPGTSGRNEWVLDITNASGKFGENDVFALELLRQYVGIAIQNVALFGELQSQRASVIQLNQLKDDLIAVLAHDFKGPLTTIIGFTELLEQHALEGEDADGALRTIRQSALRLASLANDTLALSRVEQGELNLAADPVNVAEIAKETVESLLPQREIVLDVRAADPVVRGDPARLRQVFENLIGNAIKYSSDESPVEVRVTETDSTVRVAITDRGIGIPPDEMKFLFERFTRASNAKRSPIKGTGLGLYLAKTLVERHGGTIQVQSTLGEGSTFTVVLPRMRDGLGGVLRVLAVTADENLGPYVLHELRSHGYAARRDKTLTAALERLDVEQADIVIVDRDTITSEPAGLFHRAASASPRVGLIAIGGDRASESAEPWDATLPNPFLGTDLQTAVQQANQSRLGASRVQTLSS
ncbi:MAG TPA: hybrid sensor histidine kinase/response regulator [Candidatus Baltobacteraceae bacterium]|jgi:signal transduction histidine kinase|nr:hybrid sensor histidine kinase/response regulator [Candidatus Baltobacteraceae bacterium]